MLTPHRILARTCEQIIRVRDKRAEVPEDGVQVCQRNDLQPRQDVRPADCNEKMRKSEYALITARDHYEMIGG